MTTPTPEKKKAPEPAPYYIIMMDEKRSLALGAILAASIAHGAQLLTSLLVKADVQKEFTEMMAETAAAMHERNWCKSPVCPHASHKKVEE